MDTPKIFDRGNPQDSTSQALLTMPIGLLVFSVKNMAIPLYPYRPSSKTIVKLFNDKITKVPNF